VNDGTGRSEFLVDFGWVLMILNRSSLGFCIFLRVLHLTFGSECAIWAVYLLPFLILILSNRLFLLEEWFFFLAT
jgi:hypothetical protein